ncbi:hypothetical protein G7Y89_g14716 [Cudoniella acicularis]|uniref:1-alkyl-2-acetylglycerophosphocholine esterase n=1 Tax=Cudoniella acicularis TaxID=354080 RepID=A0A8H4QYR9_9HELO|nr:hypothetical protein G7Y89_g14716 [Cudoniella acicularis]
MLHYAISGLLIAVVGVVGIQLPNLTGRYPVGTVSLELIDDSRIDPFTPNPQPRDIMVSVFYPTSTTAITSGNYSFAPYFSSSKTAAAFDSYLGNSTEILGIATQSYYKAPIANNDFPVLIFSHGLGSSRFMYTAQLEALASQGWIIVAPDHPYDALITEFPNGNVIRIDPSVLDDFPSKMPSLVEVRVADVGFIASALKNSTTLSQIPGLISSGGTLRSNRIGIFGHSLGGNTAAQAVSNSSKFPCGANFDGGIFGPVAKSGLDKPFLQIEAQDHPQTSDATFAKFWVQLRGFRREFMVNGTVHVAFMDIPVLRDLLGEAFPVQLRNQSGTIAGERVLEIETALTDTFFAFCLKGTSADELDHLAQGRFPEVSIP